MGARYIRDATSQAALNAIKAFGGEIALFQQRECDPLSVWVMPLEEVRERTEGQRIQSDLTSKGFRVPLTQPGLRARVKNVVMTAGIVTVNTVKPHGMTEGQLIRVKMDVRNELLEGRVMVATVPAQTTLTYETDDLSELSLVASGDVEAIIEEGDEILFEGDVFEVRRITMDQLRATARLDCEHTQPKSLGV